MRKSKKKRSIIREPTIRKLGRLYLQGVPVDEIAVKLDISARSVTYYLNSKFRPVWRKLMEEDSATDLAQVRIIQQAAWDRYEKTKDPNDLNKAIWAIEHRAKLRGSYAPQRHRVEVGGELRVAGKTRGELDQEMIALLLERVRVRVEQQQKMQIVAEVADDTAEESDEAADDVGMEIDVDSCEADDD